jgi:uncharacterized protein (TIGR03086 family)
MNGPGAIWQQAADKWSETMAQVGDDQWDASTPCEDWTVRELVDHCMHWQAMGAQMVGGAAQPGDDWETVVKPQLAEALNDPSNLAGTVPQFGGLPKHQMVGVLIGDLVIHSWDLARAIGADDTLPPACVEATMMGLSRFPEEQMRGNMFGPEVEVPDDASAQDKLIGFVGRQP